MDQKDEPSSSGARRKQKFKPRAPPPRRSTPIPSLPKQPEVAAADDETAQAEEPSYYPGSYCPILLPLRRPNSGDPEKLNEAEFGDAAEKSETADEFTINPASDLGLLDESDKKKGQPSAQDSQEESDNKKKLFFFQLPSKLPGVMRSASAEDEEKAESSVPSESRRGPERCTSLEELPQGYVGKMQIYKSGAVKLKLGDVLFDVSPGTDCIFPEDVMAVDTTEKRCCNIGKIEKHAVVTPNVESLLDSMIKLG